MKILVIGSGGREHALVWKLSQSPRVEKIYCAPGNAGIEALAACIPIAPLNFKELIAFVKETAIDLTIVGPEDPLLEGIVNAFEAKGLPIYGPRKEAALIEGSKSFAKDLMRRYGIPTADYAEFTAFDAAWEYVREKGAPIVIKADGLAAGKGVVVALTLADAKQALEEMMTKGTLGSAGAKVVIEEFLEGQEVTLLSFVDGTTVLPMEPAQDHKTVFDGDQGPNTGGMGCISPVPQISKEILEEAVRTIVQPIAKALVQEGRSFRGILYTGLMITNKGPKVIEFNARFGDPETQVILPRLKTDLIDIVEASLQGKLAAIELEWLTESALCVVLSSPGYPGNYPKGLPVSGLELDEADTLIFHAGTAQDENGTYKTNGGRVLAVTGLGDTMQAAYDHAYMRVKKISFEGVHYRKDIGHKAFRS